MGRRWYEMQRDQGKWWGDRGRLLRKRLTVNKLLSLLMREPTSGWMNAEQHFLLQRRDWTESQKGEKNSDAKKQRDRMVKRPKEELQRTDSDGKVSAVEFTQWTPLIWASVFNDDSSYYDGITRNNKAKGCSEEKRRFVGDHPLSLNAKLFRIAVTAEMRCPYDHSPDELRLPSAFRLFGIVARFSRVRPDAWWSDQFLGFAPKWLTRSACQHKSA